MKDAYIFTKA